MDKLVFAQAHEGQQQGGNHGQEHRYHRQGQGIQDAVDEIRSILGQKGEIDKAGRARIGKQLNDVEGRSGRPSTGVTLWDQDGA